MNTNRTVPLSRHDFLRTGSLGATALGLGDLFRARAAAEASGEPKSDTACIFVWLHGTTTR